MSETFCDSHAKQSLWVKGSSDLVFSRQPALWEVGSPHCSSLTGPTSAEPKGNAEIWTMKDQGIWRNVFLIQNDTKCWLQHASLHNKCCTSGTAKEPLDAEPSSDTPLPVPPFSCWPEDMPGLPVIFGVDLTTWLFQMLFALADVTQRLHVELF